MNRNVITTQYFFQLFFLQYQRREYLQILQLCFCISSRTNTHRTQENEINITFVLKNAFKSERIILSLKWSLTFYSKVCRRCLRKPGHCKWIVFITSGDSQNMEEEFHSFSFLLDIAECLGLQCTDTTFRDFLLLSTTIYLSR